MMLKNVFGGQKLTLLVTADKGVAYVALITDALGEVVPNLAIRILAA